MGGPQRWSGRFKEEENIFSLRGIEHPIAQLLAKAL